jgi:hypothetical protein
VPSQLHEVLVRFFRNRPELAPLLLNEALHVKLPPYSEVKIESANFSDIVPAEYRADLVVLLVEGKPVLGIIVEVQLDHDDDKRYTWPVYVAGLRARFKCECCVLVVTPNSTTARWASKPIIIGPGGHWAPLVLGPEGVPVVTDAEKARRFPELAVLSVMAHGHGDVQTAVNIAQVAAAAAVDLDSDNQALYFDLIEAALGEAARKAFEMLPETYQFQGPTYLRGRAEGEAKAVIAFLEARGLSVTDQQRSQILECSDAERLSSWVRKAATLTDVNDLFEQ